MTTQRRSILLGFLFTAIAAGASLAFDSERSSTSSTSKPAKTETKPVTTPTRLVGTGRLPDHVLDQIGKTIPVPRIQADPKPTTKTTVARVTKARPKTTTATSKAKPSSQSSPSPARSSTTTTKSTGSTTSTKSSSCKPTPARRG